MKPELFLLIFTAIFAAFVWCCHWYLNAIQASEDAKLKLMSLAENNGQKREVAELLSKRRVTVGDIKRLGEKFSTEQIRHVDSEKKWAIEEFVNEHRAVIGRVTTDEARSIYAKFSKENAETKSKDNDDD